MRYLLFVLVLTLGLVACDPEDAVDVDVNPSQAVEDAVNRFGEGVQGVGDTLENFGQGVEGGAENAGEEVEENVED